VKPHVISVFSDISLAIEGDFERYTNVILGILKQAGEVNLSPDTEDEDLIDYINNLRNSILEAYTGILQVSFMFTKLPCIIIYYGRDWAPVRSRILLHLQWTVLLSFCVAVLKINIAQMRF